MKKALILMFLVLGSLAQAATVIQTEAKLQQYHGGSIMPDHVHGEAIVKLAPEVYQEVFGDYGWRTDDIDLSKNQRVANLLPGARYIRRIMKEVPTGDPEAMERIQAAGADRLFKLVYDNSVRPYRYPMDKLQFIGTKYQLEQSGAGEVYPNLIYQSQEDDQMPNDPMFVDGEQWALDNKENPLLDINVKPVWAKGITGSKNFLMVDMDSWVSPTHEDLFANFNAGLSKVFAGRNQADGLFHGVHTAGIGCAVGNNGLDISGVMWMCDLVSAQIIYPDRYGNGIVDEGVTLAAYAYVLTLRSPVIFVNNSFRSRSPSKLLHDLIASDKRIVVSAAAGNDGGKDADGNVICGWPACFSTDPEIGGRVISVASMDRNGKMAVSSNFGDIAAPGVGILSTFGINTTAVKSGTSMAAPHIWGSVGLLASGLERSTDLSKVDPAIFKRAIIGRARYNPNFGDNMPSRQLDVAAAWDELEKMFAPAPPPPPPPAPPAPVPSVTHRVRHPHPGPTGHGS